jgi:4-amino-4-deoxychorismate lyase
LIIKNELVTDTSIANIAFFDGEKWLTPKKPLLKGTTRARLLENGEIFEADIDVHTLKNYTQVALLNAMIDFDIISEDKQKAIYC